MSKQYTVQGRWPFPIDMPRSDQSRPATPKNQELVDALSGKFLPDGVAIDETFEVTLLIDHGRPNGARWRSFGWQVKGEFLPHIPAKPRSGFILNQAQAGAVFSAMCALNNVGGLLRAEFEGGDLSVQEHHKSGKVSVVRLVGKPARQEFESYENQNAFSVAYGV